MSDRIKEIAKIDKHGKITYRWIGGEKEPVKVKKIKKVPKSGESTN